MTQEKMKELADLQRQILSVVWRYVKPGGRLIYSTCTVDSMENEENARWFAGNFPFEPVDLRPALEPRFPAESLKEGWIQFLPGIHPMDGFSSRYLPAKRLNRTRDAGQKRIRSVYVGFKGP